MAGSNVIERSVQASEARLAGVLVSAMDAFISVDAQQRIVARHGGKTWAQGAVGAGAISYFSLPRANGG